MAQTQVELPNFALFRVQDGRFISQNKNCVQILINRPIWIKFYLSKI